MRGDAGFPVRLRYSKLGRIRFVSHRDLARTFERAFRIEQLPLAFSQGFSPRPKISFGLALGVGHESRAEYLDFELSRPVALDGLAERLSAELPEGIEVTGAIALVDRAPALQESVAAVELLLRLDDTSPERVEEIAAAAVAAPSLVVETSRKGRPVTEDLRPALRRIVVGGRGDQEGWGGGPEVALLDLEVTTRPRGVRPADLIGALRSLVPGNPSTRGEDRVLRTRQWIERDGARLEPLEADRAMRTSPVRITSKGPGNDRGDEVGTGDLGARDEDEHRAPLGRGRRIA